jgi:hypothetical protein
MTLLVEDSSKTFIGAGTVGPFTWTWRFFDNDDITAKRISDEGVETALVETTDYVLTGANTYQGGVLTLVAILAVGETLYVERNSPALQEVDLRNQGDFFPETYEEALDKTVAMVQDKGRAGDNSLRYSPPATGVSRIFPAPVPLNLVRFKADGLGLESIAVPTLLPGGVVEADIVERVTDIFSLINVSGPDVNKTYLVLGFFFTAPESKPKGGGAFVWQAGLNKINANGGTIIDPGNTGGFDGTVSTLAAFLAAQGGGIGTGCWVSIQEKGIFHISSFGAVSDGVTSDHAPTQAAADTAETGDTIVIPGNTFYNIHVNIPGGINVITTGLVLDGTSGFPLFNIGSTSVMDTSGAKYYFKVKRKTTSDFSSLNDAAVRFINISQAQIDIRFIQGYTIGFIMEADTSLTSSDLGCAWNTVNVGIVTDCLIVVDQRLTSGGGGTPFGNQNEFFFYGAYTNRNLVATNLTTDGNFVDGTDITTYIIRGFNINGNSYYNPAIEMSWLRPGDGQQFRGTGILLEDSRNNKLYDARFEDAIGAVAKITGDSRENSFSVLYSDPSHNPAIIDESIRKSNYLFLQSDTGEIQSKGVWDSGNLSQSATSGSSPAFPKLLNVGFLTKSTDADPTPISAYTAHYVSPEYLEITSGTNGIAVRVDTSLSKEFVLKRELSGAFGGRVAFSAREADGTQIITGAPVATPLAVLTLESSGAFKSWGFPTDVTGDVVFKVTDSVDHVVIYLAGGTNPQKIKRFQIHVLGNGTPIVTPGFVGGNTGQRMSELSPLLGQYEAGETVFNSAPASAEAYCWITSVAGFASNQSYSPSSAVSQGNYKYIAGSPDEVYYCQQAGTTGASSEPTAAGGKGQVDGTVIWDYAGPRATHIAGPAIP